MAFPRNLALIFTLANYGSLGDAARILSKPEDTVVEMKEKTTFLCAGGGSPKPAITWMLNNQTLSQSNRDRSIQITEKNGVSSLRIDPTRISRNNTIVSCIAGSGQGSATRAVANLIVLTPEQLPPGFPKLITSPPSVEAVEKGRTTAMRCDGSGDPEPEIIWLHNLLPVNNTTPGNPGLLLITNATESDEGKYECMLRNKWGVVHSMTTRLYVKVRLSPPRFSEPPKAVYEVNMGDSVNVTCAAVGNPIPYVFFVNDSFDIQNPTKGRNVLELHNVLATKNYTCVATSQLGAIDESTIIKVRDPLSIDPDLKRQFHKLMFTVGQKLKQKDIAIQELEDQLSQCRRSNSHV